MDSLLLDYTLHESRKNHLWEPKQNITFHDAVTKLFGHALKSNPACLTDALNSMVRCVRKNRGEKKKDVDFSELCNVALDFFETEPVEWRWWDKPGGDEMAESFKTIFTAFVDAVKYLGQRDDVLWQKACKILSHQIANNIEVGRY